MTPIEIGGLRPVNHDFGIVEALPTQNLAPGVTCTFKVATGVYWKLVYTGEATYPWAKVGGPALVKAEAASKSTSSEAVQTTGAPSVTAPLALEANFQFGANRLLTPGSGFGLVTLLLNGAGSGVQALGGGVGIQMPLMGEFPGGVLAKGQLAVAGYSKIAGTGAAEFLGLYVNVDPLRVG